MNEIRIVLVDDHRVVREGTRQILQKETDLRVIGEAGDGEEAIRLVSELKPDVVVMDISMPRLNGIEATKRIKAMYPHIAVLILTAYEQDQYIFAALEAGAAGYLLKDIHGQELVAAIRSVQAGESVLHPIVARKALDRFVRAEIKDMVPQFEALTDREVEVLRLAARGRSNAEIAGDLGISTRTVQGHFGKIFEKFQVSSRTEAIVYGLKYDLLKLSDLEDPSLL